MISKNIIYLFIIIILITGCRNKDDISPIQAEYFVKLFGSSFNDMANDIKQTKDGGYIFIGTTTENVDKGTDIYFVKTDKYGNEQWSEFYGDSLNDVGESFQLTNDGGYILLGTTTINSNDKDIYLIKTNSQGKKEWENKIDNNNLNQEGKCVNLTNDGGYIIIGNTEIIKTPENVLNNFLIKTDENGDTIWTKIKGGANDAIGNYVIQNSSNEYLVVGATKNFPLPNNYYNIIVNLYYDNGNIGTSLPFDKGNESICQNIQMIPNNEGYIIVGTTYNQDNQSKDIFVAKLGNDINNIIWETTIGGNQEDVGQAICLTKDGGYAIIGSTKSQGSGASDIYLVKINNEGEEIFNRTYGSTGVDFGKAILQTEDEGYVIIGTTGFEGNDMITLIKTNPEGLLE